ncbi:toll/interleukin-1 receptor domain-containing protein [Glutamicibacter sp. 0426]|uniref:toll/interleukin-1 receptor domain-containing protein n=1 Tax=Glutamicibacter sp. 0426 TaxID=1913445 RepID=UPI00093C58E1|nr:toll/interleukin-1 receptor domain-containing protein [Glutamicibacter sp. 0426]
MTKVFLSHSSIDKPIVRQVMAELLMMGADPFYDEVSITNGAVIPHDIDMALGITDTFVLFWSKDAAVADWVTSERVTAWGMFHNQPSRFVVVILDDTDLPPTLKFKKWIDARNDHSHIASEILGLNNDTKLIMAVQKTFESWGIEVAYVPGYGAYVGCPDCGAVISDVEQWSQVDHNREELYVGVRCNKCKWEDGGGVPF